MAAFYQASGFSKFVAFCADVNAGNITDESIASPVQAIPMEDGEEEDDWKEQIECEKWQGPNIIPNDYPSPRVRRQKVKQKARFNLDLTPKLPCTPPPIHL